MIEFLVLVDLDLVILRADPASTCTPRGFTNTADEFLGLARQIYQYMLLFLCGVFLPGTSGRLVVFAGTANAAPPAALIRVTKET